MLGPVNVMPNSSQRGFTLIELMVVVALVAIILALAAPSFTGTLARKRMEGVASELATDIQYARSEAAQRNAPVRVIVGANCYAVHVVGSTNASSCAALGTDAVNLKTAQVTGGTSLAFVSNNAKPYLEFDPVRGMAIDSSDADSSGYVTVTNIAGNWQIQAKVSKQGRVKLCSPNNTVTSLATDCN
jgi:type IV fimbrial biogenesis protein FimT